MSLRYPAYLLACAATGYAVLAGADTVADLQQCRGIVDTAARLGCYDAIAAPPVTVIAPPPPAAAAPAPQAAEFGAEAIRKKSSPAAPEQSLQARLPGHYEILKKGDRYKLDNGQVWLNVNDREVLVFADDPDVRIERNFIGSYWMSLGSRGTQIRVRRIQ